MVALRLNAGFFLVAAAAFRLLLGTGPCLFGTANRMLFFLHAVLLDLTELAQ
jgi:hypothetical protein